MDAISILVAFLTVLTTVLAAVIGAAFRWIWSIKTKDIPRLKDEVRKLSNSYFGVKGNEGHLEQVSDQLDDVAESIERLERQQAEMERQRMTEHEEVRDSLAAVVAVLEDEDINGDLPDEDDF